MISKDKLKQEQLKEHKLFFKQWIDRQTGFYCEVKYPQMSLPSEINRSHSENMFSELLQKFCEKKRKSALTFLVKCAKELGLKTFEHQFEYFKQTVTPAADKLIGFTHHEAIALYSEAIEARKKELQEELA